MQKLVEISIKEYRYDSEEERNTPIVEMEKQGYECDGLVKKSDEPMYKDDREHYWFARFAKMTK